MQKWLNFGIYFGTIATGYLIQVDPESSAALQDAGRASCKEGILASLTDCRFHMECLALALGGQRLLMGTVEPHHCLMPPGQRIKTD